MTPPSDTPNHPYRRESLSQHTAATPENIDHRHHHHSIHQQMDEIREDTRRPDESQNESDFFEFFPHLSTGAESSYGQGLPEMNPPIGSQFDGFHVDLDHLTNNPPGPSIADLFKDSAMTPTMVEFGAPQVDLTALPNSWGSDSAGVYESIRTRLQDTEFELSTGGQARLTPAAVGMWADFMADTLMWATKLHGGPSYAKQES